MKKTQLHQCGILADFYTSAWLEQFVSMMKKIGTKNINNAVRQEHTWDVLYGTSQYQIVMHHLRAVMSKGVDFKIPVLISLKQRHFELGPHADSPLTAPFGRPYYTFMLPCDHFDKFSTFVYNQCSDTIMGPYFADTVPEMFPILPDDQSVLHKAELDFVPENVRKRLSLKKCIPYQANGISYWRSNILHSGSRHSQTLETPKHTILVLTVDQLN